MPHADERIRAILAEAGDFLRNRFRGLPRHCEKARHDLVTKADLQAERLITDRLCQLTPDVDVLGEETGRGPRALDDAWVVDPIDGTTNFVMGKPYFAISVARWRQGRVTAGYVHDPVSGDLYHATAESGGSFLNGQPIRVSGTDALKASLVVFGFSADMPAIRSYHTTWGRVFSECGKGVGWTAPALTLCNLARGRIDAFIDNGASANGQAAGALIAANAGAVLWNRDLSPYAPGVRGIVACTPGIAADLERSGRHASPEPLLRAAGELDYTLVRNLVPYYIYDMSESMGWECDREGRYDGCDELPEYWTKKGHHPYVVVVGGKTAGFALVRPSPAEPGRMEIGEFFILRAFRGCGVGTQVAAQLFDAFAGEWLVRVLDGNVPARAFWEQVVSGYTNGDFEQTSEVYQYPHSGRWPMQFFRFRSQQAQ